MVGNFDSIAGGSQPGCRQCAAPPLGTQGFLWGLIFMTGFVGAALLVGFLLLAVLDQHPPTDHDGASSRSAVMMGSVFYFLFYDSLDVPMMVTMMTIGLEQPGTTQSLAERPGDA